MSRIIKYISVKNYRGFKEEHVLDLSCTDNITYLIGQNNSGKSLIARLVSLLNRKGDLREEIPEITDNDFYNVNSSSPILIKIEIDKDSLSNNQSEHIKCKALENVILCFNIVKEQKSFQCYTYISDGSLNSYKLTESSTYSLFDFEYEVSFGLRYSLKKEDAEKMCQALMRFVKDLFLVFAPIRSFDRSHNTSFLKTGLEIIQWLKDDRDRAEIRNAKVKIREYLNRLNLEDPVSIKADDKQNILIFTFREDLELSSNDIGTGYTMIYILLFEILKNKKKIVIIEEIESHLQPGLIRELLRIIREIGSSQYIISTHSPTVLECASDNDILYRFQKNGKECTFTKFYKNNDNIKIVRSICNDLGIIPGDALLSNSVIWVEGPSEILWIRTWMKNYLPIYKESKKIKANIIEGLHYSILMTGGSLIANMSFEEDTTILDNVLQNYTLKVLRINPHPFVIIDSDNSQEASEKSKRQLRIAKELNDQNRTHSFFPAIEEEVDKENINQVKNLWILKGKELENYIHPQLLKDFYTGIANNRNSKIEGASTITNWNVYSSTQGVGEILESRGLKNVKEKSGTIKHKAQLASYVFDNFKDSHFRENVMSFEEPHPEMINELKEKLTDLFDYIVQINSLNSPN